MSIIMTIKPVYIEGKGDCTEVIATSSGRVLIEKKIKTVMEEIMENRLISYKFLNKRIKEITGVNKLYPIYPTYLEMFIPMNIRTPMISGDAAYGYINENYIDSIYKGVIKTKSGEEFKLLEKESTFNKRRELCEIIRNHFENDKYLSIMFDKPIDVSREIQNIEKDMEILINLLKGKKWKISNATILIEKCRKMSKKIKYCIKVRQMKKMGSNHKIS